MRIFILLIVQCKVSLVLHSESRHEMLLFVTIAREAATEHHSGLSIRGRVLSVSITVTARLSLWFLKKVPN